MGITHNLREVLVNFSLHDFQEIGSKGASRAFNNVLECVRKIFFPQVYNILLGLVFQVH